MGLPTSWAGWIVALIGHGSGLKQESVEPDWYGHCQNLFLHVWSRPFFISYRNKDKEYIAYPALSHDGDLSASIQVRMVLYWLQNNNVHAR